MSDFGDKLFRTLFSYMSEFSVKKVTEMAGFKYEGSTEIMQKLFLLNNSSFQKECKFTIAGRKDNSLEIIISHPGMEDTKCINPTSLEYIGFDGKGGKNKINYKHNNTEVEFEMNPKDKQYNFIINIYYDKRVYQQAMKLHKLKTEGK